MNFRAHILPYGGVMPQIGAGLRLGGARIAVLGRAQIGEGAVLGDGVTIRADGHSVQIGPGFWMGERGLVHIAHDLYPTQIGHRVSAGADAVIHACTVGPDCVIGAGAIILDGSVLGPGVVLDPGAVVFPRSVLAAGQRYAGVPATAVGPVTPEERAALHHALRAGAAVPLQAPGGADLPDIFVARSARLAGRIEAGAEASVFFGCDLVAAPGRVIRIGARSNVQDNSRLRADGADLVIGADTTIGHNVQMTDCSVGPGSLIGIGSRLAPGTVVDSDVLLAAGAVTEPGQHLGGGWLWGGNPARQIAPLTDARRQVIAGTIGHYCSYARAFRAAQEAGDSPA